jgi:hypothetical protein
MMKFKILALLNLFGFLVHGGLFYCIHFQFIFRDAVSKATAPYHSLFFPGIDITFGGWGVIYTGLAIFCLYHLKMAFTQSEKNHANQDIARVDIFFFLLNIVSIAWLVALAEGSLATSVMILAVQMLLVLKIHHRLEIYKRNRKARSNLFTQVPLSIYAGWVSLLILAGISDLFQVNSGLWHLLLLGFVVLVALLVMFIRHNIFYGLMIMVGLYGNSVKSDALTTNSYNITLAIWTAMGILALGSFIKIIIDYRLKRPSQIFHRTAYE